MRGGNREEDLAVGVMADRILRRPKGMPSAAERINNTNTGVCVCVCVCVHMCAHICAGALWLRIL